MSSRKRKTSTPDEAATPPKTRRTSQRVPSDTSTVTPASVARESKSGASAPLFQSSDPHDWSRALDLYPRVIKELASRKKKSESEIEKFLELDRWFQEGLPKVIQVRHSTSGSGDTYITKEEISKLMKWKLSRGTFRPKLQQLVDGIPSEMVETTSRHAFAHVLEVKRSGDQWVKAVHKLLGAGGEFRKALDTLTTLPGVGPATASAILCAFEPRMTPFFADDAAESVFPKEKIAYTAPYYVRYVKAVWGKCRELHEQQGGSSTVALGAHDVEKAVWSDALARKFGISV